MYPDENAEVQETMATEPSAAQAASTAPRAEDQSKPKKSTKKKGSTKKAKATKPKQESTTKVWKRITAPSRLEKLNAQFAEGKLPSGIKRRSSGGRVEYREYVNE